LYLENCILNNKSKKKHLFSGQKHENFQAKGRK